MNKADAWTRRDIVRLGLAAGLAPPFAFGSQTMIERRIPVSGEALPVIGLGTWQVFDVPSTPQALQGPRRIVDLLVEHGGSVVDSSPMYGRSEKVVGDVIESGIDRNDLFLATKVWTDGKVSGMQQMERSAELMNTKVIDLMQVHNRRDLDVHLETIRQWQAQKRIRYSGVTDYQESALDEMEALMKRHRPNFIQINYSLGEHAADDRVLPLAQDLGIAVLINRPFMSGRLFRAVRGRELPDWASDLAGSWGQFFLKFIVSQAAVTCVIPATSDPEHMVDNLGAGFGELPDAAMRAKMIRFIGDV
ncbi:MAG TPA: aldo/keto reductase [Woeseiaceae bacterium]|nr:aldo/keto reductase [Woeseiaceae bacterium]